MGNAGVTAVLITNIGELTTKVATDGDPCGTLHDAAVLIDGERIVWVGRAEGSSVAELVEASQSDPTVGTGSADIVDAGGRAVIRASSTVTPNLVFAGDRADEFEARMAGTPYAAGGIRPYGHRHSCGDRR